MEEIKNSTIDQGNDLQGDAIHEIFELADRIADLHLSLTSSRGSYFRKRLLGKLTKPYAEEQIREFAEESGISEYKRHIHKLAQFGLVSQREKNPGELDYSKVAYTYMRTYNGEEAVNVIRSLEGKIGLAEAKKLFDSFLGPNSTRLFLKIYSQDRPVDMKAQEVIYTPLEIGQLSNFLPRTVEGIAAVDKLDDAGLVTYMDSGKIHVNLKRSTAFYRYLKGLYNILKSSTRQNS